MIEIFEIPAIVSKLEIITESSNKGNGTTQIILRIEDFVKALSMMGYLYVEGKYYKLDGELWKLVNVPDGVKEFWPLEKECRNLLDYVKDHWGDRHNGQTAPAGLLLDSRQIDTIVRQFNSTYDLNYLSNERRKWIDYAQSTMDDFYARNKGKINLSPEFLPESRVKYDVQERIDDSDHIVAFRNGFIDLTQQFNHELIPHTRYLFIPEFYNIDFKQLDKDGLDYQCAQLGMTYDEIYQSIIPDEDALSVYMRYIALSFFSLGHVDRFLFIYGIRDSGKSTLRYAISKLMGPRSSVMTFRDLTSDFGLTPFIYTNLAFMDDSSPPKDKERTTLGEIMKSVTNNGQIEIHQKYKKPVQIENRTQIVVISNHPDVFGGMSTSVIKRVIALPCRQTHDKPIPNLKEILEGEDSLNWLVNRLLVVYDHDLYHKSSGEILKGLSCDYTTQARRELYANAGDIIPKFIDEVLGLDASNVHEVQNYIVDHPSATKLEEQIRAFCDTWDYREPDKEEVRAHICKEYGFKLGRTTDRGTRMTINVAYLRSVGA